MAQDSGKNTITLPLSHVRNIYWPICGLLVTAVQLQNFVVEYFHDFRNYTKTTEMFITKISVQHS